MRRGASSADGSMRPRGRKSCAHYIWKQKVYKKCNVDYCLRIMLQL